MGNLEFVEVFVRFVILVRGGRRLSHGERVSDGHDEEARNHR